MFSDDLNDLLLLNSQCGKCVTELLTGPSFSKAGRRAGSYHCKSKQSMHDRCGTQSRCNTGHAFAIIGCRLDSVHLGYLPSRGLRLSQGWAWKASLKVTPVQPRVTFACGLMPASRSCVQSMEYRIRHCTKLILVHFGIMLFVPSQGDLLSACSSHDHVQKL